MGFVRRVADQDALAKGEAVGLDDEWVDRVVDESVGVARRVKDGGVGNRNAGAVKEIGGPGLAGFEASSGGAGTERADTRVLQAVSQPQGAGVLRADDDQIRSVGYGPVHETGHVVSGQGDRRCNPGDGGVAGRAIEVRIRAVGVNPPAEGVLAAAASDDEDLHSHSIVPGGLDVTS